MEVSELIKIVNNRLRFLEKRRDECFQAGDLDSIVSLDNEIEITQRTLNQLNSLIDRL